MSAPQIVNHQRLSQHQSHRPSSSTSSLHALLSPQPIATMSQSPVLAAVANNMDTNSTSAFCPATNATATTTTTTTTTTTPHTRREPPRSSLPRGSACTNCRVKKLKCTGERPVCAPCIHAAHRVRALLSNAIHGVGPDGERVDKRGRKRKSVSSEDMPECRYEDKEVKERRPGGKAKDKVETPSKMQNMGTLPSFDQIAGMGRYPLPSNVPLPLRTPSAPQAWPLVSPPTLADSLYSSSSDDRPNQHLPPSWTNSSPGSSMPDWQSSTPRLAISNTGIGMLAQDTMMQPRMETYAIQPPLAAWDLNAIVLNDGEVEVMPGSPLEYALVHYILPHTPHLSMPVYPPRFLDSLLLPSSHRPHPSLLYILFAESVRAMASFLPLPPDPEVIPARYPMPYPEWVGHIRAQGPRLADIFLERSRRELDAGIRAVDRPYDLTRASIGISRYLYSVGRFIEGWNVPCTRLLVSCGIHRITNPVVVNASLTRGRKMSASYLSTDAGGPSPPMSHTSNTPSDLAHSFSSFGRPSSTSMPFMDAVDPQAPTRLRMKPVIIRPPADPFELAERIQMFWAIKAMDWAACVGWGWTGSLADADVQTVWPRPYREYEEQSVDPQAVTSIWDLMNPQYAPQGLPSDTTQIMAYKTLCLLHKATLLFDLPHPPSTTLTHGPTSPGSLPVPHPMTAETLRKLSSAMEAYRGILPLDAPNGESDPWWIMTQANMLCAEMLLHAEEAVFQPSKHELAVTAARRMVVMVERLRPEDCTHLDLVVAIDISLAARFLYLEAARLQRTGCPSNAFAAAEGEAGVLHHALNDKVGKWMHMARLHGMIVQRVREGLPEKDGEYERL